jgi:hypothetical protein
MTSAHAVHAVGASIVTHLRQSYPADLRRDHPCDFTLVSTSKLATFKDDPPGTTVALLLYRVSTNPDLRNASRLDPALGRRPPLSVDLHYLLSVWAESAETEHVVLAWAMAKLHETPVLDRALLADVDHDVHWLPEDLIQLIPAELSNEDVMRIWDALEPSYRLSYSYVARVVRIDPREVEPELPAVFDTRFAWTDTGAEPR